MHLAAAEAGGDPLAAAERVCHLVPELVRYTPGTTSVPTTAALEQGQGQGQGVCQDQAHVMPAVCRAAGIACRYVSGHIIGWYSGSSRGTLTGERHLVAEDLTPTS